MTEDDAADLADSITMIASEQGQIEADQAEEAQRKAEQKGRRGART